MILASSSYKEKQSALSRFILAGQARRTAGYCEETLRGTDAGSGNELGFLVEVKPGVSRSRHVMRRNLGHQEASFYHSTTLNILGINGL